MARRRLVKGGVTIACSFLFLLANCSRTQIESLPKAPASPSAVVPTAPAPEPPPSRLETVSEPPPYVHTVRRRGETLALISLWYTGSVDNWKRLTDTNKGLDPRRMKLGDKIFIPAELMRTHQPMPPGFKTSMVPKKSTPAPVKPAPYVHVVRRSGETLGAISLWYTGSADNWRRLIGDNKRLDPRNIQVGDKILIPVNLMKTHQPMPANFMTSQAQSHQRPPSSSPAPRPAGAPIELFGPIESHGGGDTTEEGGLPLESIE